MENMLENLKKFRLVLASNSPRRKELLAGLDVDYEVRVLPGIDESYPDGLSGEEIPKYISRKKAEAYEAIMQPDELIITADTIVWTDGKVLGKPKDEADAVRMLRALSGRAHRVHTGVCICRGRRAAATVETTSVHFSPIEEDDLRIYVRTPEPYDKAGAYAIQGHAALWCAGIEGCYYNIMGLPVHRTAQLLREFQ